MRALSAWLRRADPGATALILPERKVSYGEAARLAGRPGRPGLSLPAGAPAIALELLSAGLAGGTVLLLPPGLEAARRERLLALAAAEVDSRLALIIATSGSEGAPKGVKLSWRSVAAAARISGAAVGLQPGDVWLACLPLHHVGGALIPYRCWRAGATALIHDGFDADAVLRDLARHRVSHVSLVPPMLARLVEAGSRPPASLRCALVGGAALSAPLFERAVRLGWPVCPTYGMTETCAMATVWLRPTTAEWREGAVGAPLSGVRPRLTSAGHLAIATPARMRGYLGEAAAGEWLETRDLAAIDERGRVHIRGRADDMLISAGVNVHPLEVEARLAACPGVREAGVAGLRDPVWGDVIAAIYEGEAAEPAVERWCREHLPTARRPRRFLRVERLPRLASGKLDRRALATLMAAP